MTRSRVLLVDDDELVRYRLAETLEQHEFEVVPAKSVYEALKRIAAERFDVLLSDLHMPGAGDGLTMVSAMRLANPRAATILLSGFPEMAAAARAILMQADEIVTKPVDARALMKVIRARVAADTGAPARVESVATILEQGMDRAIERWLESVHADEQLMSRRLSDVTRSRS